MDEQTKTKQTEKKRRTSPDPRTFFVVWSPEGGDPVVRYPTFEAAKHSAWRLSEKYPAQNFFVLKSCWGRLARATEDTATVGEARNPGPALPEDPEARDHAPGDRMAPGGTGTP